MFLLLFSISTRARKLAGLPRFAFQLDPRPPKALVRMYCLGPPHTNKVENRRVSVTDMLLDLERNTLETMRRPGFNARHNSCRPFVTILKRFCAPVFISRRGTPIYISYMGMCRTLGYGFRAVLV